MTYGKYPKVPGWAHIVSSVGTIFQTRLESRNMKPPTFLSLILYIYMIEINGNIYRHSCSVGSLIATILANPVQDVDSEMLLLQFRDINPLVGIIPRRIGKPTITIRNLETPWQPSARLLSWLLSILGVQVLCRTTTCPGWHIWGCHTPNWKVKKKQEDAHGTVLAYMCFFFKLGM